MKTDPRARRLLASSLLFLFLGITVANARADLPPEWIVNVPTGSALGAGYTDRAVDASGVTYVTSITGPSSNTDVQTVAFGPDGATLWTQRFDGPEAWHDQARDITIAPDGTVWVVGNTPDPNRYANVLLLAYDAASGAPVRTVQYTSGPFTSEAGAAVATDAQGNVFVAGNTVGDGPDVMVLKFDAAGNFLWKRTWDGPAASPYSQDSSRQIEIAPDGNPIVLVHGVMSSLHPDYVVLKLDADDGTSIWESNWGVSGGDFPREMELDSSGDVFVTGTGIDFTDKFSTIKLRGSDGALLWQAYDSVDFHNAAYALALDHLGGVYITGHVDPDGDRSNANGDMYTIKRDAATGEQLWTRRFGAACNRCGDVSTDVIVAPGGHVLLIGRSSSPPYNGDVILFDLDAATGIERDRGVIAPGTSPGPAAGQLAFDADYNLYNTGGATHPDTGEKAVAVVKYPSLVESAYRMEVPELVVGSEITFRVVNATAAKNQFLLFSTTGPGETPVPKLRVMLGLVAPRLLASGPADASGTYATTVRIPPRAAGRSVWLQAAEKDHVTDVLDRSVP